LNIVPLPDLLFAFMATIFLFNSKKKDGKEMPPLKLMPLRPKGLPSVALPCAPQH